MNKSVIESSVIIPALKAGTKDDSFREMLDKLVEEEVLKATSRAAVSKKLKARERKGSTGLGNGIAVPHVKGAGVEEVRLLLALSKEGLSYDAIDGRPVHTIFLVLAPPDQPEEHLRVLRWISGLARNPDFRRFVMSSKTEGEIRDLLFEMTELS